MRVTVVRPADLGADEASLWASFQQSSPATRTPFLSLTFAQVVGRFRPNARVAVAEADGRIDAFVAFELTRGRIGLPIGYPMNNLQGFVSSGPPVDARRVIRKAGLRGWRFVAAPEQQHALTPHHYEDATVPAPLIDLTDGYKPYYLSRSKKLIQDTEYRIRTLERRVGPVSLEWGTNAAEHVRQLIEWKNAKYGGARELFADPATRRIVEELAGTASEECGGLVNVLRAGDRAVAIVSGLTYPGVLSGWFTAYDQDMRRFSPGTIALLATAEEAARRDITRIDMGAGQDDYKSRLSNASYPVAGGVVWTIPGEHAARRIYRRYRSRRGTRRPD